MTERENQDAAIRQALQADAEAALDLIWAAYGRLLFALVAGIIDSRHDAEEVQQELFMRIARQRHRLARADNLRAYLCTMARHAAVSWWWWRQSDLQDLLRPDPQDDRPPAATPPPQTDGAAPATNRLAGTGPVLLLNTLCPGCA